MEEVTRYWQDPNGALYPQGADSDADSTGDVRLVPVDAIVIERSELPEVVPEGAAFKVGSLKFHPSDYDGDPIVKSRREALATLAFSEYLREHPPVDEALLKEATAFFTKGGEGSFWDNASDRPEVFAERLIRAGWKK